MTKKTIIYLLLIVGFNFAIRLEASPYSSLDFPEIITNLKNPKKSRKIITQVDPDRLSANYKLVDINGEQLAEAYAQIQGDMLKINFSKLDFSVPEQDIERILKHLELAGATSKCQILRLSTDNLEYLSVFNKFGFSSKNSYLEKIINLKELQNFFIRNQTNKEDKQKMEVDIGRKSEFLGNPFLISCYSPEEYPENELKNLCVCEFDILHPRQRNDVCQEYFVYLHAENMIVRIQKANRVQIFNSNLAREHAYEVKGKILGCYCAPDRCHGNTLFGFANNLEEEIKEFDVCDIDFRKKNMKKYRHIVFKEE